MENDAPERRRETLAPAASSSLAATCGPAPRSDLVDGASAFVSASISASRPFASSSSMRARRASERKATLARVSGEEPAPGRMEAQARTSSEEPLPRSGALASSGSATTWACRAFSAAVLAFTAPA